MQTADSQVQPHDNPLGYAPVEKLIAMYAIPAILSMLVTAAYKCMAMRRQILCFLR